MNVKVLVGDYHGRIAAPLVGRHGRDLYLFTDHRHTLAARQDAVRAVVPYGTVEHMEIVVTDEKPPCEQGAHTWESVERDVGVVAGRCVLCGHVEWLPEPYPGDLAPVVRASAV